MPVPKLLINDEVLQERRIIGFMLGFPGREINRTLGEPEPVFLNVYGAQESIPRNAFRQLM